MNQVCFLVGEEFAIYGETHIFSCRHCIMNSCCKFLTTISIGERGRGCLLELNNLMICRLPRQAVGYMCPYHARYPVRTTLRGPHLEHSFPTPCLSLLFLLHFSSFCLFWFSSFGRTRHIPNYHMTFSPASDLQRNGGAFSAAFITRGRARAAMCVHVSKELHGSTKRTVFSLL